MNVASFIDLQALAQIAPVYQMLRREHPLVPARLVHMYARDPGGPENFEQFVCGATRGHEWSYYTESVYGGDDESCEGRCYCAHCGLDGDA